MNAVPRLACSRDGGDNKRTKPPSFVVDGGGLFAICTSFGRARLCCGDTDARSLAKRNQTPPCLSRAGGYRRRRWRKRSMYECVTRVGVETIVVVVLFCE